MVNLLIGAAVVLGGLATMVALRPGDYRVARSAQIGAAPATVFAHINDLRKFNAWNPWAKLDPAARTTFDGPAEGVGAVMAWAGDRNVGEGRMTVIESRPHELVRYRMEFLKPFAATATAEFTLSPAGAGATHVTWAMQGENNFMAKAMHLVMNMDRMIGGQFEKGLAGLGAAAASTRS